jgi:mannose/fructose/N-acetylgalactosamine-specific phosphotransferase system component IIC
MSMRLRFLLSACLVLALVTSVGSANAYIGPGAGAGFVTSLLTTLSVIALAILAILVWPIRLLLKRWRKRRAQAQSVSKADDPS